MLQLKNKLIRVIIGFMSEIIVKLAETSDQDGFWDVLSKISSIVSIFALIVGLLFLTTPRLLSSISIHDNLIRVDTLNINWTGNPIYNVSCEIALSQNFEFSGEVKTLELVKDKTLCLLKRKGKSELHNYVFKSELTDFVIIKNPITISENDSDKKYILIRVRYIVQNIIGMNKVLEFTTSVENLIGKSKYYQPSKPSRNNSTI